MQEDNPTQYDLTASDREYAQRNGLSSSDMLEFKEDLMIEEEKDTLVQRRLWALVYYVRSLERVKGTFYWLFGENPELQTGARGR